MQVPTHLEPMWPCYRLWLADKVTWTEVETVMSIQDVLEGNEMLDAWNVAQRAAQESPQ